MAIQIQIRGGTAADWTSANPILAEKEPGYETDTGKIKFGDGVSDWNSLPYFSAGSGGYQGGWDYSAHANADPAWTDGNWGYSVGGRGAPGDLDYVPDGALIYKLGSNFKYVL